MIRIENLVKQYGSVRALDGLSLNVEPGAVYGFLGPNGAGKTTTMRILSGLARADSGQAWILDQEVGRPGTDVRSLIGVLPEEPAFYPWMRAVEYLRDFIGPLYGLSPKESASRAAELLELAGLKEASRRKIAGFSRGMRQRLGIAQALMNRPHVLLLDEPVSALDPAGRKEILDLIEKLRGEITILLSTHILADVERVCDLIGIIAKGKMIIQERCDTLLESYALPIYEIESEAGFGGWIEQAQKLTTVSDVSLDNSTARILVKDVKAAQGELMASLLESGISIRRFEVVRPSLEDIFLRLTTTQTA